ncbi:VWA domain-containing protein [Methanolobus sp.]|uniref:VWA domain-containing protein n=1 Tax=Methanolobus sp. TaxID=1874737 RepID=UPI0025EF8DD9|nr:VWA domain-containing protein [Methanolobus sp.]
MVQFENPAVLWLIIPAVIAGLYMLKKVKRKELIISRIIVVVLLITAFASPFILVPRVTIDDSPDLVIISDETESMALFANGTASELYEALTAKTPATLVKLTGDSTSLGDSIVQYSTGDNQIVLVTDGNSNTGQDVEDALQFAQETGTSVYLVQPELENNDLTVQIEGDKTVIQNNENQFNIVVSQAMEQQITYSYELYNDDTLIRSATVTQTEREKTIPITQVTFSKLGAHTLKVVIVPEGSDVDEINNVFYKSVYAVPKPKISAINLDTTSPLGGILLNLYDVSTVRGLENIDNKKVILIDNTAARTFTDDDVQQMKEYLNEGRGIIVVGGDGSYNFGNYLNSSIEEILPVLSKPTDWSGGRNIVLVLDISPSSRDHQTLDDILANALAILDDKNLRDSNLGVIAFGSEGTDVSGGLLFLGTASNMEFLDSEIRTLTPGSASDTSLDKGLAIAQEWLQNEAGELQIIIISDGGIKYSYDDSLAIAENIVGEGVNLYYVHISSSAPSQVDDYGNLYAEKLMNEVGGTYFHIEQEERANIKFDKLPQETNDNETDDSGTYPLIELNTKHFITKDIDINGTITGYNDVTPKAGADRLIITSTGKPVLTTWRYGLGRVAALTTDNGKGGENMWATQLYSGNNSKLISSTVNWAIGNPREETGAVVDAPDTWYGTPVTIELTMYDEGIPTLKLDNAEVDLSLTGTNVYEADINPSPIGIHDLSGYPVAVNYALEYRDVGINEDLPVLIKAYGGSTYTVNEARANLLEEAKGNSEKLVRDSVSQKIYFLIAALIVFLGEVILRRIKEIKEMKKLEQEIRT